MKYPESQLLCSLAGIALGLALCFAFIKPKSSEESHVHHWGQWQDTSTNVTRNGLGMTVLEQKRYCTNCNLGQIELHQ